MEKGKRLNSMSTSQTPFDDPIKHPKEYYSRFLDQIAVNLLYLPQEISDPGDVRQNH